MLVSSLQLFPPNLISLLNTTATGEGERSVDCLKELYYIILFVEVAPGVIGAP
jgi:hypothetical protein